MYFLPEKKHTISLLGTTDTTTKQIEIGPLDHKGAFHLTPGGRILPDQIWEPEPGKFYYQFRSSMESFNSFALTIKRELIIFQVTIAAQHPIETRGLQLLLERLKGHYNTCILVIVCPVVSDLSTVQSMVTSVDAEASQLPEIMRQYNLNSVQWRLSSSEFDDLWTRA